MRVYPPQLERERLVPPIASLLYASALGERERELVCVCVCVFSVNYIPFKSARLSILSFGLLSVYQIMAEYNNINVDLFAGFSSFRPLLESHLSPPSPQVHLLTLHRLTATRESLVTSSNITHTLTNWRGVLIHAYPHHVCYVCILFCLSKTVILVRGRVGRVGRVGRGGGCASSWSQQEVSGWSLAGCRGEQTIFLIPLPTCAKPYLGRRDNWISSDLILLIN